MLPSADVFTCRTKIREIGKIRISEGRGLLSSGRVFFPRNLSVVLYLRISGRQKKIERRSQNVLSNKNNFSVECVPSARSCNLQLPKLNYVKCPTKSVRRCSEKEAARNSKRGKGEHKELAERKKWKKVWYVEGEPNKLFDYNKRGALNLI